MAFPQDPLPTPNFAAGAVTAAMLDAKITTPLNQLQALVGDDTGWLNVRSIVTGWTVPTGFVCQARQIGIFIYMRGVLQNSAFTGGWTTICTLPVGVAPPVYDSAFPVGGNTDAVRSVQVLTGGTVQARTSAATSSFYTFQSVQYVAN